MGPGLRAWGLTLLQVRQPDPGLEIHDQSPESRAYLGDAAPKTFIATAIIPATSDTLAGTTTVFVFCAICPNCDTYCSATRSCTASMPPSVRMAEATWRMPSAVAAATARIAAASPSASLIWYWRFAPHALIACRLSPPPAVSPASGCPPAA